MNKLPLQTAVCCMACDGDISEKETLLLEKSSILSPIDKEELKSEIIRFNDVGKTYLREYIYSLSEYSNSLDNQTKIRLLSIAVEMIKADGVVKYSEINFFKLIFNTLNVTQQFVLENITGIDEDWVENDFRLTKEEMFQNYFNDQKLSKFEHTDLLSQFIK